MRLSYKSSYSNSVIIQFIIFRFDFATEMLDLLDGNHGLVDRIWWSDESTFNLNGTVNRHNSYYWDEKNPNITIEKKPKSLGLSVWAAISSQGIIGPYFFHSSPQNGIFPHFSPCNVNGANYLDLLQNFFYPKFQDLPDHEDHLLMQDGAPPHYAIPVRAWLNGTLTDQWIGRGLPLDTCKILWPPRSPDLTPCDYFLWGFIKHHTYSQNPSTLFELQQCIIEAFKKVTPEMLERVCRSVPGRLKTCIDLGGAQVTRNLY